MGGFAVKEKKQVQNNEIKTAPEDREQRYHRCQAAHRLVGELEPLPRHSLGGLVVSPVAALASVFAGEENLRVGPQPTRQHLKHTQKHNETPKILNSKKNKRMEGERELNGKPSESCERKHEEDEEEA